MLEVTAYSPTNRPLGCPVSEDNGTFYASFQPDEAGEWRIHVTYDNEDIENSPFRCMVFDPRAVHVSASDILLHNDVPQIVDFVKSEHCAGDMCVQGNRVR